MKWLDSITITITLKLMDMNLSKLGETVENRRAWPAMAHGVAKSLL